MLQSRCERTAHFTFSSDDMPLEIRKNLQSTMNNMQSIKEERDIASTRQRQPKSEICLPINFFHSPGEYNKMLIKCSSPELDNQMERKLGLIKNLQFMNQPLFQKQREKKYERIAQYCRKSAKESSNKSDKASTVQCSCCCCDNYCRECAKDANCRGIRDTVQLKKEDLLIDIQAIMRREKPKPKKKIYKDVKISQQLSAAHFCCQPKIRSELGIQRLINESLIKEIEQKRQKELEKLSKWQREQLKEAFSRTVRNLNRPKSAPKIQEPKLKAPTKKDLRESYWNSVKDLVSHQLKKDKVKHSLEKEEIKAESPTKTKLFKLSKEQMNKLRIDHGKEALKKEKLIKEQEKKLEKITAKKLLALQAQQAEIITQNRKQKFKPTKKMVQDAFKIVQ